MKRSLGTLALATAALAGCDQISGMTGGGDDPAPEIVTAETPSAETPELETPEIVETTPVKVVFSMEPDPKKITASEAVNVTVVEAGVVLSGGTAELASGGQTKGAHFALGSRLEEAASGKKVRISVTAQSDEGDAKLFAAYSTADVGNSGWREWDISNNSGELSFVYDVPPLKNGRNEFLGFYAPAGPVTLTAVKVEVLE